MPIEDLSGVAQYVMDLVAIFAFALSGAFIAVRRDFDIFGTVILSEAAGLGGGFFRDLVLRVQPVAFTDLGYFFTPIGAAALVYFGHRLSTGRLVSSSALFDVSDAGALGLFSVSGTIKALAHGLNVPAAVTLGCASAVGGAGCWPACWPWRCPRCCGGTGTCTRCPRSSARARSPYSTWPAC
ncbi:trimeric intracellular cation channel family protein [Streptomyces aurantiacus]|uniref:Glycine transporter domain-containing protein n=1 Tax=Streptomyces aurantiacus TaxID=47760 RepID=A0A7G1PEJ4_9ACTN|nr:hypothetical protein GCM10017557_70350 [Streptomyces aurantiacus]